MKINHKKMTYNTEIYNPAKVYGENKAKGFWNHREALIEYAEKNGLGDKMRNMVVMECLALINSELVEALTARNEGKICQRGTIEEVMALEDSFFVVAFRERIKDTYQDEIADAVIRALDLLGGFGKTLDTAGLLIDRQNHSEDNLLAAMQVLNDGVEALRKPDGNVWVHINRFGAFCIENWGHFLEGHIVAKRKFNKTRAYLHDKTF